VKPARGRLTTTALHTIHTAKERKSDAIEIQRFRRAMISPWQLQKVSPS
jgi:hypothetical protein